MKKKKHKILILDGDKATLKIIAKYLSWNGFSVDTMNDAEEVLSRIEKKKYSLVICDELLAPDNGYALCEKIRGHSKEVVSAVNIIIIAAEDPDIEKYATLKRCNAFFLNKYASPGRWLSKIKLIIGDDQ
ncbi:MAG: response regulator [Waddliaceae bacterium]|jgi:two-component system, OmpR family, response regulator|nr:response regulator [Waddliaceae bacterium]MBT3578907.1 response regulator [Waddliaceae bacterium]MBT4445017.1 response regulator [Waddliaceae bacterium]MBT6929025.1 response regulator [Waddliaceae bacterium]MBT7264024.1 response regulator [Waddliaceae bacterium]